MHGVLLLDKPTGISSNAALQRAKNLFRARKAGHTGSLDPLATGMLPICFGEATKLSTYLLASDKSYCTTAQLGVVTDSGDSDGAVIKTNSIPEPLTEQGVESELARLRGSIEQVPPMYSALKHQGERLYKLARQGKTVERKARSVTIHELLLKALDNDTVTLSVRCSKGTYIRTLVEDLGQALGCGAHITMLRRTGVDPYDGLPMLSLDELTELQEHGGDEALDECLLPLDSALEHMPAITLIDHEPGLFANGGRLPLGRERAEANAVLQTSLRVYAEAPAGRQFLGIAELIESGKADSASSPATVDVAHKPLILQPKKVLNL